MSTKRKPAALSEHEVDTLIIAQADDDSAWGKPVRVQKTKAATVSLSSALATRIAFFARLHREKNIATWVERIIKERLDLEEAAFAGLKRDLAAKHSTYQDA